MVVIRMARGGAKKSPFYNIVVTDSRKRRDSGYIERLGYFNPKARGQEVRLKLDTDKVDAWVAKGAKPSERVQLLIKQAKAGPSEVAPIEEKVAAKVEAEVVETVETTEVAEEVTETTEPAEAVESTEETTASTESEEPAA